MVSIVIAFLVGCIIGYVVCIVTRIVKNKGASVGHGYFSIKPGPDPELPELVTVSCRLCMDEDLSQAKMIVLNKEEARK